MKKETTTPPIHINEVYFVLDNYYSCKQFLGWELCIPFLFSVLGFGWFDPVLLDFVCAVLVLQFYVCTSPVCTEDAVSLESFTVSGSYSLSVSSSIQRGGV